MDSWGNVLITPCVPKSKRCKSRVFNFREWFASLQEKRFIPNLTDFFRIFYLSVNIYKILRELEDGTVGVLSLNYCFLKSSFIVPKRNDGYNLIRKLYEYLKKT